tara:strand:+ start:70 stop:834 length:765 start_codon:yes stop_codon:yes gene_type:complete
MKLIFNKLAKYIKTNGLYETIKKILSYPFEIVIYRLHLHKINKLNSNSLKFKYIYDKNIWSSEESVSGIGSTLKYTKKLRDHLPDFFKKYEIKSILDAPCGDFNWMQKVLEDCDLTYLGGDIVDNLIHKLNSEYSNEKIRFINLDICKDDLPDVDLIFVRDCLFHLSNDDIKRFIQNFQRSNIKYLFTTSHKNNNFFENKDVVTGSFRRIDLFSAPYSFSKNFIEEIEDYIQPYPERSMYLWEKNDLLTDNFSL